MPVTLANRITLIRILLVPFFIMALLYYSPEQTFWLRVALAILLLAVFSDIADGYLARKRGEKSSLGILLDPLADKMLLMSGFICLNQIGVHLPVFRFPTWLIVTAISRDVVLIVGSALIVIHHGSLCIEATWWGKISTMSQVAVIAGMLLQWSWSELLWPFVVLSCGVSGLDYLMKGFKLLNIENPGGSS